MKPLHLCNLTPDDPSKTIVTAMGVGRLVDWSAQPGTMSSVGGRQAIYVGGTYWDNREESIEAASLINLMPDMVRSLLLDEAAPLIVGVGEPERKVRLCAGCGAATVIVAHKSDCHLDRILRELGYPDAASRAKARQEMLEAMTKP